MTPARDRDDWSTDDDEEGGVGVDMEVDMDVNVDVDVDVDLGAQENVARRLWGQKKAQHHDANNNKNRDKDRDKDKDKDANKSYRRVLGEIKDELERHVRFVASGLRGVARATSDGAAAKWDLLANMLETG